MSSDEALEWTSWVGELVFAVLAAAGGIGVLAFVWVEEGPRALQKIADDPARATSEEGLLLLGGLALLLAGLLLWLLAPRGVRIDVKREVVLRWRGRFPRILKRETPFARIQRLRITSRTTRSGQYGRRRVYDYYLDTQGEGAVFVATRSEPDERAALQEQLCRVLDVSAETER